MILVTLVKHNKTLLAPSATLNESLGVFYYTYMQQATQIFTCKRSKIYLVIHAVLDADNGEPERWKISTA